jgi:6-phosphogluconate dehydrogenase (decarboxylating)
MMEQTEMRDWNKEKEQVDAIGMKNWFKPEPRVNYQVTFLDEGGPEYERTFEDERTITQVDFCVRVTGGGVVGQEYTWTVTKGGPDSLYGQLVEVFVKKGKAVGCTVEVDVRGEGKQRRYFVRG